MPHTRLRMYSLSSQPFSKMCHSRPQIRAMSVPGAEADILGGVRGGAREARIADDHRRVVLLLGLEQVLQRHGMRLGGVAADEEHRLRLHDVVVGVRHGAVAPRVRDARDRGGVADARLVVAVVGAPERRRTCGTDTPARWRTWPSPASRPKSWPDVWRISSILSPISLMATSQPMRVHFPATSFIGYLSRRSPCACSRAAAPLAQWAPRLKGLSKPGSWPIHTPFCTSAMIVQPTEQCVQTVFLMSILPPVAAPRLRLSAPDPRLPRRQRGRRWRGPNSSRTRAGRLHRAPEPAAPTTTARSWRRRSSFS